MPSYGGNAHITHKCYIPFLFAIRQWELPRLLSSDAFSIIHEKRRHDMGQLLYHCPSIK